jgi:hypothetical protein
MFKKLFSKKEPKTYGPTEPIYPGELFEVSEITDANGFFGFSNINKSYDNYPNKKYFPWWIQVTLELVNMDDRKMPTESGFRDIIFYVQEPRFDQEKTNIFFDQVQEKRRVNFTMEKDVEWKNVSGLIK